VAIKTARKKASKMPVEYEVRIGSDGTEYNHFWLDQFFHEEMNKLTEEAGLRVL